MSAQIAPSRVTASTSFGYALLLLFLALPLKDPTLLELGVQAFPLLGRDGRVVLYARASPCSWASERNAAMFFFRFLTHVKNLTHTGSRLSLDEFAGDDPAAALRDLSADAPRDYRSALLLLEAVPVHDRLIQSLF